MWASVSAASKGISVFDLLPATPASITAAFSAISAALPPAVPCPANDDHVLPFAQLLVLLTSTPTHMTTKAAQALCCTPDKLAVIAKHLRSTDTCMQTAAAMLVSALVTDNAEALVIVVCGVLDPLCAVIEELEVEHFGAQMMAISLSSASVSSSSERVARLTTQCLRALHALCVGDSLVREVLRKDLVSRKPAAVRAIVQLSTCSGSVEVRTTASALLTGLGLEYC